MSDIELVKYSELNKYSKKKKDLFLLNVRYLELLKTSLPENFNLIYVQYNLSHVNGDGDDVLEIFLNLKEVISGSKTSIVMGYSFNGYIAFQLACIIPQIAYCVLVDTRNLFMPQIYDSKKNIKALFRNSFKQIITNKDYTYFFFLLKKGYLKSTAKTNYEINFFNNVRPFLKYLSFKPAINNCIFFQASRSYFFIENHGLTWHPFVAGKFHFLNIISAHDKLLKKNAPKIANFIERVVVNN